MSKVTLGTAGGCDVSIDLDVLLRTRLLVQANSGGGKSYLLRRLAEQLFGKAQVLILDPEGEFATLRERFGYVLVGKGGETPADTRSAALVAHKLLELHASAVCDLYELPASQRHYWVKVFLEALIDAPKKLWHPVVVVVDEAHTFCPEKGAGESVASDAMIGLATRGRKRGFCSVFATQRLGKLRKDAAAELLNVLIGQTFIDVDRKRAAEALGIPRAEERDFFAQVKTCRPGQFWALGRAITLERTLVTVGNVETTHPEPGSAKHGAEPPPPPGKVKALLPKLADLPKEAEEKARTEAELRAEIRSLKAQIAARPTVEVSKVETKTVEVPALDDKDRLLVMDFAESLARVEEGVRDAIREYVPDAVAASARILEKLGRLNGRTYAETERRQAPPATRGLPGAYGRSVRRGDQPSERVRPHALDVEGLSGPEQRIVDAIAWYEAIGIEEPTQVGVAFLAGYTIGGGAWNNPRGRLHTRGLVEYCGDCIRLTDAGRLLANAPSVPLTAEELQARVISRIDGPMRRILEPLLAAYPAAMKNEELAEAAGYSQGGGAFNNPRGRLRTCGLIEYPEPGAVRAAPLLFLESR